MKQFLEEFGWVVLIALFVLVGIKAVHGQSNILTTYSGSITNHPLIKAGGTTNGAITNFFINYAGASNTNASVMSGVYKLNLYQSSNVFGSGNSTNANVWFVELPVILTNSGSNIAKRLILMNGLIIGITNY